MAVHIGLQQFLRGLFHKNTSFQQNLLTPYYPQADLGYKSLQFNRYADDFVVGIIGSREDAERVKADIRGFLVDELKLTLSEEKTKITHSSELINYLGYQFTVRRSRDTKRDENGILRRMWYGKVALYVPHDKWVQKLKEYQAFKIVTSNDGKERWKPLHRGKLMHKDAIAIISQFNAEIRGLYNYYCLIIKRVGAQQFLLGRAVEGFEGQRRTGAENDANVVQVYRAMSRVLRKSQATLTTPDLQTNGEPDTSRGVRPVREGVLLKPLGLTQYGAAVSTL